MKKIFKSTVSVVLVMLMVFGSMGIVGEKNNFIDIKASAASSYDPDKAIAYAAANWNNGVGLCAEFVSNCLTAGGVSIMQKKVSGLESALRTGGYGTLYKLTSSATQWGQVAKMSDNSGKVKVGDPLFTYCSVCGYTHAVICGGVDSSGYITIYAHNSAKDNKKYYADCTSHSASYISIYSFSMNTHTHDYVKVDYQPNCTSPGTYYYYCSCGANYTSTYSAALGHDFSKLSYCEDAHPHYKVYACSRNGCTETKKSTETSFGNSCVLCNPSAFCANLGDDFYGVILNTACWKPISKEGSNNITLETEAGISAQKWRFQRQSDGAYVITSCYDGTTLEMTDGIRTNDTQLSAKDGYWGGNYQQWYLIPQGNGLIFLSKHYTGEQWVMDLFENDTFDGNSITIQPRNNTEAQIWSVYNREEVQLQPAKISASVENSKVTFTWPNAYGATSYSLKICTDEAWNGQGGIYLREENVKSGYSVELPAGTYYAYIDSEDYYSFIMSNVVTINISDKTPEKPVITSVTSNDEGMVTVKWTECERAECYSLRFYKSGEHYKTLLCVTKDTEYWCELPDGTYTVKVTAEGEDASLNDGCWNDSEMSDEFTVVCEDKNTDNGTTCSKCGATFESEELLNEHMASCNADGSSGGGSFFSLLLNIFFFIIGLLILPFKLIF